MSGALLAELVPYFIAMAVLVAGSAFFSGSETALFSLSRGQRERLSRSPRSSERAAAHMLGDPKRLIATLLIGNELVNITFSSLVAQVVQIALEGHSVLVITLVAATCAVPLLLLFGEVTPKSIGLAVPEIWARLAAHPLRLFMLLVTPVRVVIVAIAGGVARIFGLDAKGGPKKLGEAEFKALVDVGSETGELQAAERKLIHNVFEFGDRPVAEIMTPSKDVFGLPIDVPLARAVGEVAKAGFSRVPVHRGRKQEVVGILFAKDLVGWASGRLARKTLAELLRPATYVPKTSKCAQVFAEFQRARTHLAMVVDEYGRQVGLVTMEDLLGELFADLGSGRPGQGGEAGEVGEGGPAAAPPAGEASS